MAVAHLVSSTLRLVFIDGMDEDGKTIYKNKSFRNVKTDADEDQLYAIAQAFVGLQERDLNKIERTDSSDIQEG
ncbi:MAG TPA: DUF1659 domain-containing protein [Virgibacillus sp.]|nr:DUF1659 domain-containing protein [Virgibacillus sp.]